MHGMKFDRCDGLTKRELFAAMALQAFIPTIDGARNTGVRDIAEKTIVASVAAADMLLAELAKGQP